ncbi:Serine-protein kinase ATM [Portunus trituberculatus]|uniref:Serine-protein kinase ATM n=1 Tax=Portunus trituberculatus TaxID=210409 RepID=A0A5B7JJ13_PORTR|nr:Serine-protein kinase ATM [Portunus trituberculatus]
MVAGLGVLGIEGPLRGWCEATLRVLRDSCDNSVSMAERVVLKMRQKLVGMEEGFPSSVPDQVTRLLQDATSPSNLCRLFAGWQAYV